jgi:uncharacterized protein DUF2878
MALLPNRQTYIELLRNPSFWNGLIFQLGWFLCVTGGDVIALGAALAGLILHAVIGRCGWAEWLCIGVAALIGITLDSALHYFGVLQFSNVTGWGVPLWLASLWLLFATTLNRSLRWLQTRPLLAALCGALFAPLSYWAGAQIGTASFGIATTIALTVLTAAWSLLLPILSAMMRLGALRNRAETAY